MQITFVGVGEACDERLTNTSLLVHTENASILMDCGFSVPHALLSLHPSAARDLNAVWISHFHGDHFFGLPLLFLRLWEEGRKEALTVFGPPGIERVVPESVELAYPGFWDKFSFSIHTRVLHPEVPVQELGCTWRGAWTEHSQPNLGLRLDRGQTGLYYSGDGRPGPGTRDLIQGCSMLVHEGFRVDQAKHGHGTVREVMDLAARAEVRHLAVVHMQRDERRQRAHEVHNLLQGMSSVQACLPEPQDVIKDI